VLDVVRAQFPLEDTLDQVKQALGVNPLTDITAITVYNNSFQKDIAAVFDLRQGGPNPSHKRPGSKPRLQKKHLQRSRHSHLDRCQ